ncbi:hypothetical protein JCM39068_01090 [Desulfocastanea catecholica]
MANDTSILSHASKERSFYSMMISIAGAIRIKTHIVASPISTFKPINSKAPSRTIVNSFIL